jgi:23S rRNA pseudouridine1911/1915/1917 synthase
MKYRIKKEQAGLRLDKFLTEKIKNKSRAEIQKIIESGNVSVSGSFKNKHYFLKDGDLLEIVAQKAKTAGTESVSFGAIAVEPEIIFENDDFLVVNKPSGLIVHGAPHIKQTTLADWLLKKYPKLKRVGEDKYRPGIMHRLDKEASGLLVIAKNNESFFHFKKQFQQRLVDKEYIALVYGEVSKESDSINFSIKRSAAGYRQAALPEGYEEGIEDAGDSRDALTEFKVIKRFQNYTLLRVKIKSGRKHQIRVHFYAYGHPLVGDDLYSTRKSKTANKELKLGRIFLVSAYLSFFAANGERYEFSLPLPPELENFLNSLKS